MAALRVMLGQGLGSDALSTVAAAASMFAALHIGVRCCVGIAFPQLERSVARRVSLEATTGIFSVYACVLTLKILLSPDEAMMLDHFYGFSPRTQSLCGVVVGFFVFELAVIWIHSKDLFEWGSVLHGIGTGLSFYLCLCPFAHRWISLVVMYELSTPFLKVYKILLLVGPNCKRIISACQILFGLTFGLMRVVFGIPAVLQFWRELGQVVVEGRAHSYVYVLLAVAITLGMSCLNLVWFAKILAMRKKARSRH